MKEVIVYNLRTKSKESYPDMEALARTYGFEELDIQMLKEGHMRKMIKIRRVGGTPIRPGKSHYVHGNSKSISIVYPNGEVHHFSSYKECIETLRMNRANLSMLIERGHLYGYKLVTDPK